MADERTDMHPAAKRTFSEERARQIEARIDEDIELLTEELQDLPQRVDHMVEGDPFPFEWDGATLGLLSRLHEHYEASEMTDAQERGFRRLRAEFSEQVPLMERAGLARPRIPLED